MTEVLIDPQRLKTVRKARKVGRAKLAKGTRLTERQLTKLETAKAPIAVSELALDRMAHVLQIPVQALTGELPLIEDDLKPVEKTCTSGCCG